MNITGQLFITLLLKPFLFSLLVAFIGTALVIPLANKFGLVDDPKFRKHPAHLHVGVWF